jgi:hypothetical protein
VKHGSGKVTVWGMITPHSLGWLVHIEGNLQKELYCNILLEDILGTIDDLELDVSDYFQQDNNPKHMSHLMTA